MPLERSEARNRVRETNSSWVTSRPKEVPDTRRLNISSVVMPAAFDFRSSCQSVRGPSMLPRLMQLTRMFCRPDSWARVWVSPDIPHLDAL